MADIALGSVGRIVDIALKIKEAVENVKQNEKDCRDIERCVARVTALIKRLDEVTEAIKEEVMHDALEDLAESLEGALDLVTKCQRKHVVRRFIGAGDMAKELRQVQDDILRKVTIGSFATNVVQLGITLMTIAQAAPPPERHQQGAETDKPSHGGHPITIGDARYETDQTNKSATGSGALSIPLSGLTKFNFSELEVATQKFSEINKIGRGGFAVVYKTCLLYLTTYPEDSYISKDKLIWKWIAEGFVHEKQGERLFELGERYFNDLINRSMIQAVDTLSDGNVLGCLVHDIVLDLLRNFSFEEKFIAILDGKAEAKSLPSNVRRFALHNRIAEHVSSQMPKVRSYTAFGCDINNNWVHFPSFRLLRVLNLKECRFREGCHLEHLGDLLHLRYLGIECGGSIPRLSKQITNLKLLQTLILHGTLPVSIDLPTQLLCLHAPMWGPDGIGKLTSLEELSISGDLKMFVKQLGSLLELRVLRITTTHDMDKSMQRDFVASLSNLQKIQEIEMFTVRLLNADTAMWEEAGFMLPRSLRHLSMSIYFSKLPSCINPSSFPNLSYLRLWVDTMDEKDLKLLARLPALSSLNLQIKSTITASIFNAGGNDGYFQKLRYFTINAMVQLQQHNTCISLHICNREDALAFGSKKSNCRKNVPTAVMLNLEVLEFHVPLRAPKDNNGDCTNIGLEYLPSLRQVTVHINCEGVSTEEVDAALVALRHVCKLHPNHPTLDTYEFNKAKMVPIEDKEDEKQQEEAEVVNNIDLGKLSPASS